jgi:5-methylcytosine-specific restriction enzyme B
VLIVDEINRANLSRVFGELMYLLEYRDERIRLAAGGALQIPKNVRLLGTMNTADRSIALVDQALRRRFAFIGLRPNYEVLRHYHADTGFAVDGLVRVLQQVNSTVGDPNYALGPSFFLRSEVPEQLEDIWRLEVEPYLEEYFFDQPGKVEELRWDRVRSRLLP